MRLFFQKTHRLRQKSTKNALAFFKYVNYRSNSLIILYIMLKDFAESIKNNPNQHQEETPITHEAVVDGVCNSLANEISKISNSSDDHKFSIQDPTFAKQLRELSMHFCMIEDENVRTYAVNIVKEMSKIFTAEKAKTYYEDLVG